MLNLRLRFSPLSIVVLSCLIVITSTLKTQFTILHFNDINSQLEPFDKSNPASTGKDGGLASLVGQLQKEENGTKNTFRFAAGNLIGGQNGWLSLAGWQEFGQLVKDFYVPEIMGLGHKEFEGGLEKLNDYLTNASTKVLINNVNCETTFLDGSPEKKFCQDHVNTAHTLNITSDDNHTFQVGVVGFVNPIVERLADPGKLSFENVTTALNKAVNRAAGDVKSFIAVGSGSLQIARDILSQVDKIKVVILAGGSHDQYPVIQGDKYIVKAGSLGTTLGKVLLEIDSDTNSMSVVNATLIENDGSVTNLAAHDRVNKIEKKIESASEEKIGVTLVKLNASRENCWSSECNVGNLIVDSMVHCALRKLKVPAAATTIGVWPSGSMFDSLVYPGDHISMLDVHKWLPYHNDVYLVTITGETLKRIFTSSGGALIARETGEKDWGQFLQVSAGIEVKYSEKGELKGLRVFHLNDSQPILEDVKNNLTYNLVMPSFMYNGRSVYDYLPGLFSGLPDKEDIGSDDYCLTSYINGTKILNVGFEKRITIADESGDCPKCKGANTGVTVVLTLLIFLLIIGLVYVGWKFVWPRISQRGHTSSYP